jgi:TatD DNase family protein
LKWFDSHCHLHLCADNSPLDATVARARAAGVDELVTMAIDSQSSIESLRIAQRYDVFCSAGVHPNSATEYGPDARASIEDLLTASRVVAVGETGLDFYRDRAPVDVQRRSFLEHIELAHEYNKALIIHTRASVDAALDMLRAAGPPKRLVFHCWSGDLPQLNDAVEEGAYISFAGNVSFKNADDLRSVAREVPLDKILVETDSPFLAPVPHRGKPNEPAYVADVGAALAATLDLAVEDLATRTTSNARALFGLS